MRSKDQRIFISIAAYRDPELLPTLDECLAKARYPERLRFGVCWQHAADEVAAALVLGRALSNSRRRLPGKQGSVLGALRNHEAVGRRGVVSSAGFAPPLC